MQIQAIILVVLIVLNWILYHKIFLVFYFGGMRKSLTSEFIWCAIAACVELALIIAVGQWVLAAVLIIGAIILIIYAIYSIYKFFQRRKKKDVTVQSDADVGNGQENMTELETASAETNPPEKPTAIYSQNGEGNIEQQKKEESGRMEYERLLREKSEVEAAVEREKALREKLELEPRTYKGIVYQSEIEVSRARKEDNKIELLKQKLLTTKNQAERQKIMSDFKEDIRTEEALKRLNLLSVKVNQKKPRAILYNWIYGGTVALSVVITSILGTVTSIEGVWESIIVLLALWYGVGIPVWAIWKIILIVQSKSKNYYLNIKKI